MAESAYRRLDIGRFVFCDISREMLQTAKDRFSSFSGTQFILCPAQELAFHEEFDVATAIQVNHYLSRGDRRSSVKTVLTRSKAAGFSSRLKILHRTAKWEKSCIWKDGDASSWKTAGELRKAGRIWNGMEMRIFLSR